MAEWVTLRTGFRPSGTPSKVQTTSSSRSILEKEWVTVTVPRSIFTCALRVLMEISPLV
jgi:hypothetical protein